MRFLILILLLIVWGSFLGFNWDYVYNQDSMMQVDRVGYVIDRPISQNLGTQQLVVRWEDDKTVEAVNVTSIDYVKGDVNTYYIGKQLTNDPIKWRKAFWGNIFYYGNWVLGAIIFFFFVIFIMANMALTGRPFGY